MKMYIERTECMDLLLTNIGLLATPTGTSAQKGKAQGKISLVPNATIGIKDGNIAFVESGIDTPNRANYSPPSLRAHEAIQSSRSHTIATKTIDCGGRLVTPGLVDAHTHLVFGSWRQKELALKLEGASYLDILKSGGGILSTVEHTRAASETELVEKGKAHLKEMLQLGVTTCEAKSGYGLTTEDELKQLCVIRTLDKEQPIDIVPTFMGAHAVPKEFKDNRTGYIDLITNEMLPAVAKEQLAEFCDIFCETAVFSPEESRRNLSEAKKHVLTPKMHADEIDPIGGAETAAEVNAISAEHLIQASDEGIKAMADKNVIAVLLPATSFYLDKPYARARDMINSNVAVAIATDFNPGSSPSLNMQLTMNIACLKYKMTPAEVLTAVTLNGAAAINRAKTHGSIETGKKADIVIWDAPDLDYIFYRYGSNLTHTLIKNGIAYTR